MEKFERKFPTLMLNCDSPKNEHLKLIPEVRKEYQRITKARKGIGFPSVFMMDHRLKNVIGFINTQRDEIPKNVRSAQKMVRKYETRLQEEEKERREAANREWTNKEGKKVQATALKIEDRKVFLRLQSGRTIPYGLDQLTEEDQELLAELFPAN